MRPYGPKNSAPSALGQEFADNQEVSFVYRGEIHSGSIEKKLGNSAVIILHEDGVIQEKNLTKVVISYAKLLPVFNSAKKY